MKIVARYCRYVSIASMVLMMTGCSQPPAVATGGAPSLLSPELQQKIRRVMESVVEVVSVREYRIEQFDYELANGRFIPDTRSPVGYRLRGGSVLQGIHFDKKISQSFGAGLLLMHDEVRALILTSSHLVSPPDTLLSYYPEAATDTIQGRSSSAKALFSRASAISGDLSVRHPSQALIRAEIVAEDRRNDLALISVSWRPGLAATFPYSFAYRQPAAVGEVGLAIGFPEEIKQVTFGMVSPSPYPGNFALGIIGRFGFSGCPVLMIRQSGELAFAGLGRGAPYSETAIIAPPADFANGYYLQPEDVTRLRVERVQQVNAGMLYCVDIQRIGDFIAQSRAALARNQLSLPPQFSPSSR